jgi:hypothetical protein
MLPTADRTVTSASDSLNVQLPDIVTSPNRVRLGLADQKSLPPRINGDILSNTDYRNVDCLASVGTNANGHCNY